jgi:peptidylprolyl isomerase
MLKNLSIAITLLLFFGVAAEAQTRSRKRPVKRPVITKAKPKPALPLNRSIRTLSGLTYMITKRGTGVLPKKGQTVSVHYTGTLTNGVKFDSSRDRGTPIEFPLGTGRVIKGWDEGIAKMRVGDQAILVIPPTLGYGARGAGNGLIPPDATLIFIVELVDVKDS